MDYIDLIHNTFSTILLDAIQYFPQEIKKVESETYGLLFGFGEEETMECDYIFPVGNVKVRKPEMIEPDQKVNQAIKNAKQILSTSNYIGTYHSHPNETVFGGWVDPSNIDVFHATQKSVPYMIIIGIIRNIKAEKLLRIEFETSDSYKFYYDKKAEGHDAPRMDKLKTKNTIICGEFRKYQFEMRAYKLENDYLKDINLFSSEAATLARLLSEGINIETLTPEVTYNIRKIEYELRMATKLHDKEGNKIDSKVDYHLEKIRQLLEKNS